ncbi:MAG TPA: hypothetical protein VJB95_00055 [Candidatus Paceibacterota bacterium]
MSDQFGWSDPVQSKIVLAYRRKGARQEHDFHGVVYILGEDKKKLTPVPRAEIGERLDLTQVPVVGIGGKRKAQHGRIVDFLANNAGFEGAFLTYPGTGNWDLGEGMVVITSREILSGKRVSGGRPEVQLVNYRWLRDGRYVADRAQLLHGKVLKVLETELEQEPGAEKISAEMIRGAFWASFKHRLCEECDALTRKLTELEGRRVLLSGEKTRDMVALVRENVTVKLQAANVRFVREIPADLTVTAEEIAPELVAGMDTLGTIEVPGLGRRLPKKQHASFGFGDEVPTVELSIGEFRMVEAWPLVKVYPVLTELGYARDQLDYGLRSAVEMPEAERLEKVREFFAERWTKIQRSQNFPKESKVGSPREADLPATPEPVEWGYDLITGATFTAYAALRKSGGYAEHWEFQWIESPEDAAKADAEARQEAESYITARRLESELTADVVSKPLPAAVPARPKELDDYELPREKREEIAASYQTQVREFVATLESAPQWSCLSSKLTDEVRKAMEYGYDMSGLAPRLSEAWAQAEKLRELQDAGEILVNWGGYFRVMGRTGNAQYWVIRPNGQERLFDEVEYRKRYTSEGSKHWRLVGPDELAISWSKANTAASHRFAIDHRPVSDCTEAQLQTVNRIEREIEASWEGAVGMSGTTSPSIGKGWDLKSKPEPLALSPDESKPLAGESLNSALDALRARFGGK